MLLVSYFLLRIYFSNQLIHKRAQEKLDKRVKLIPSSYYQKWARMLMVMRRSQCFPPCWICLEEFEEHDRISVLPCNHCFHYKCITPWLGNKSVCCPVCKKCPYKGVDVVGGNGGE